MQCCCCSVAKCVQLFVIPWTAARQASLSFTISWILLILMFIELVMSSNHLILCCPVSCPQSFLASWSFPMTQLFSSGGQNIAASTSASVLPMDIQGWFPLGLVCNIMRLNDEILNTAWEKKWESKKAAGEEGTLEPSMVSLKIVSHMDIPWCFLPL